MSQATNTSGGAGPAATPASAIADDVVNGVASTLKNLVRDVTDPAFRNHLREVMQDAVEVEKLIVAGAESALVQRAKLHVNARTRSLLNTPGYALANQQHELLSHGSRILDGLFNYGFDAVSRAVDAALGRLGTPAT